MASDPNIKPYALNLIEEKVGNNLELIGTRKDSLNRTPLIQALRSPINKWDLMKPKSFCIANDTIIWTKWQPTGWEKIFISYTSDRGLILQNL